MTSFQWDPQVYGLCASERGRAYLDLVGRIPTEAARLVVDLGCGSGELTLGLRRRWPSALVVGLDSSTDMLEQARRMAESDPDTTQVRWLQADLAGWTPGEFGPVDVMVANASLHWVADHRQRLVTWAAAVAPGGTIAFQVPANEQAPSHALMRAVALEHPRAGQLTEVLAHRDQVGNPVEYARIFLELGWQVDAWETTYLHLLDPQGRSVNPVLDWVSGTGLRPVLDILSEPDEQAAYLCRYGQLLSEAYPRGPGGVPYPFRRVFVVATRPVVEPSPQCRTSSPPTGCQRVGDQRG